MLKPAPPKHVWITEAYEREAVARFSQKAAIPPLPALILWKRGYRDSQAVEHFLNPSLEHLHDPFRMPDMNRAVERLIMAREKNEKILIHGDYDVDGITAAALMIRGLGRLGIDSQPYLPHRLNDGYGLSEKSIQVAHQSASNLILTVDCGITAVNEALKASVSGIDLIITDHHEPSDELPCAVAVLCPKRTDSVYPFSELAGVGVAYKLLTALYLELNLSLDELNADLDLVALGTIADLVPLINENRVFASLGLEQISRTKKIGLQALIESANLSKKSITATAVGFGLAPRLNASGRMANAELGLKLLLSSNKAEAKAIAYQLDEFNKQRRVVEAHILKDAEQMAERQINEMNPRVLVCHHRSWHEGVIGIVASRLVEAFGRPAILFADKEAYLKGSGRSVKGFNLHDALSAVRENITSFGGHEAAAGIVLEKHKLRDFTLAINKYADDCSEDVFASKLFLDAEVQLDELCEETKSFFHKFRPFGIGNKAPCFASRNLEVVGTPRVFGRNHIKFTVRSDNVTLPVIMYGGADLILSLEPARPNALDLAYRLSSDDYWGVSRTQLLARDLIINHSHGEQNA